VLCIYCRTDMFVYWPPAWRLPSADCPGCQLRIARPAARSTGDGWPRGSLRGPWPGPDGLPDADAHSGLDRGCASSRHLSGCVPARMLVIEACPAWFVTSARGACGCVLTWARAGTARR